MDKKKVLIICVIVIFLIVIFFVKNLVRIDDNYEKLTINEIQVESIQNLSNNTKASEDNKIKVHITGSVNNPGLVELDVGSRIYDAIELSGGLTNDADISKTNLAYILSDGEKIYIPNVNDENIEEISLMNSERKVNINTVTAKELQNIPGVGEATANSIVEYRKQNRKI